MIRVGQCARMKDRSGRGVGQGHKGQGGAGVRRPAVSIGNMFRGAKAGLFVGEDVVGEDDVGLLTHTIELDRSSGARRGTQSMAFARQALMAAWFTYMAWCAAACPFPFLLRISQTVHVTMVHGVARHFRVLYVKEIAVKQE